MNLAASKLLLNRRLVKVCRKSFSCETPKPKCTICKFGRYVAVAGGIFAAIVGYGYYKTKKGPPPPQDCNHVKVLLNENGLSIRNQFNFIDKVVKKCASSVFYLEIRDPYKKDPVTGEPMITSNGSGFIINKDGWALTNAHVVLNKPQSTITAILRDGRSFPVHVEDADLNIDLALLKLSTSEELPELTFARSGDASVGEWVVALGSPLSLSNSVTAGIVSCVNRPSEELGLKNYSMKYIQTDASITFGNSGGPLVNLDGHVIGINNLRLTSGISFAIPIEYVKKFLDNSKYRLKQAGFMGKTMLGITTISLTPDGICKVPDGVCEGLLVWKVIEGTLGDRCGLEIGDIITHVNGVPVKEMGELYHLSCKEKTVNLDVIKQGKKTTIIMDTSKLEIP